MNAIESLDRSIQQAEAEHAAARMAFREDLALAGENLNPSSIIGRMISPNTDKQDMEDQTISPVDNVIGIASGFLTKKLLLGATHNPLLKLAGYLVQAGVTELVSRHPEQVKRAGNKVFQLLSRKKKEEKQTPEAPGI
jgi:hypothetical protein